MKTFLKGIKRSSQFPTGTEVEVDLDLLNVLKPASVSINEVIISNHSTSYDQGGQINLVLISNVPPGIYSGVRIIADIRPGREDTGFVSIYSAEGNLLASALLSENTGNGSEIVEVMLDVPIVIGVTADLIFGFLPLSDMLSNSELGYITIDGDTALLFKKCWADSNEGANDYVTPPSTIVLVDDPLAQESGYLWWVELI